MKKTHIALDWDKTLFFYEGKESIAEQDIIPIMKKKVLNWLEQGFKITIFSAKANSEKNIAEMRKKLDSVGLSKIKDITNVKEPSFDHIIDDKAIKVECNRGEMHGDFLTNDIDAMIVRRGR